MHVRSLFAATAVVFFWVSAIGSAPQTQAAGVTTAIETIVPTNFDTTWEVLLRELDEGDFTINATIRETSTIRVLLDSKIPSPWVDCGSFSVNSKHEDLGDRNYNFLAANSARYLVAHEEVNELIDVERLTSLKALATITLTPTKSGTRVNVDAHYVMKFRTREFGRNITPRFINQSVDFSSSGRATVTEEIREGAEMKTVSMDCRPTGALERQIVSVLQAPNT